VRLRRGIEPLAALGRQHVPLVAGVGALELETAVFLLLDDRVAWARLGCAYEHTGRNADAARALARGFELGCNAPEAARGSIET